MVSLWVSKRRAGVAAVAEEMEKLLLIIKQQQTRRVDKTCVMRPPVQYGMRDNVSKERIRNFRILFFITKV